MKSILGLIFFLSIFCVCFNLHGQDTSHQISRRKIELELSSFIPRNGIIIPGIGYGTEKHYGYISLLGPINTPSWGLLGGYKFFPYGRSRRANLFFSGNIIFFNYEPGDYISATLIGSLIGQGFEVRMIKEFYFTGEFAAGPLHKSYTYINNSNGTVLHTLIKVGLKKRFNTK